MVKVKEKYQSRAKEIMNYKNKKHGILRKLNTKNHPQKGYVRYVLKETTNFYGQNSARNKASKK
jgi:hypothetical protein